MRIRQMNVWKALQQCLTQSSVYVLAVVVISQRQVRHMPAKEGPSFYPVLSAGSNIIWKTCLGSHSHLLLPYLLVPCPTVCLN